jgi:cyclohexanone monooxygenase
VQPARRAADPVRHPIGAKRICTDTNYDATGINTTDTHYGLDTIGLATGFDAMTGTLAKIDIRGREGLRLGARA